MLDKGIGSMCGREADDLRFVQQLGHSQPKPFSAFFNALLKANGQVMRRRIYFNPFYALAAGEKTVGKGSTVVYVNCEFHRHHLAI